VLTALARAREQLGRRTEAADLRTAARRIVSKCPDPGRLLGPPGEEAKAAWFPDPQIRLYTSLYGTHVGAVPEEATKFAERTNR